METGVTYAEVRTWAVWLELFTASDLADAMGVSHEVGQRGVTALLWHGICEATGDHLGGAYGEEPIIRYIPIPAGTVNRNQEPPPEVVMFWMVGGDPLKRPRGMPVSLGRAGSGKTSRVGQRHPGRRGGTTKVDREAEKRARAAGLAGR